jgi:hypothetical protein
MADLRELFLFIVRAMAKPTSRGEKAAVVAVTDIAQVAGQSAPAAVIRELE